MFDNSDEEADITNREGMTKDEHKNYVERLLDKVCGLLAFAFKKGSTKCNYALALLSALLAAVCFEFDGVSYLSARLGSLVIFVVIFLCYAMPSPSASKVNAGDTYSLLVGCIFVFNMILGTGALAMPHVFAYAGWLMGLAIITLLCIISFIQLTFLVESLANANFAKEMDKWMEATKEKNSTGKMVNLNKEDDRIDGTSSEPSKVAEAPLAAGSQMDPVTMKTEEVLPSSSQLKDFFSINDKFEIGSMTQYFLYPWMSNLFFVTILAYMYGDLVIYNAMMTKSLRSVSCTYGHSCNSSLQLTERCWARSNLSRQDVYRLFLLMFMVVLIPLTYAGLTKTKSIQVITIIFRWVATISMISIAIRVIAVKKSTAKPNLASIEGFPRMFGICVYAFMCHHSVPSMLTPIDKKKNLVRSLLIVFALVLCCYYLLTMTGIFAFESIEDVYTINFVMNECKKSGDNTTAVESSAASIPVLNIFIPSYPVFTIFSSYTVIALTLINNLKILLDKWTDAEQPVLKYTYPLIAIVPPLAVTVFTEDIAFTVSMVGAYTGSLIQYVFPSLLVYYSRHVVQTKFLEPHLRKMSHDGPVEESTAKREATLALDTDRLYLESNHYASPFHHRYWVFATGFWWVFAVIMVTIDQVLKLHKKK